MGGLCATTATAIRPVVEAYMRTHFTAPITVDWKQFGELWASAEWSNTGREAFLPKRLGVRFTASALPEPKKKLPHFLTPKRNPADGAGEVQHLPPRAAH